MGKSKDKIPLWSGIVRLFEAPGKPVEDLLIESFPAKNEANARQVLMRLGHKHLDDNKFKGQNGCKVMQCNKITSVKPVKEHEKAVKQLGWWERARGVVAPFVSNPNVSQRPAYVPYSCPIVSKCEKQYTGTFSYNTTHLELTEKEGDK